MSLFRKNKIYIVTFAIIIGVSLIYRVFFKGTLFDSIDNHIEEIPVSSETYNSLVEITEPAEVTESSQIRIRVYICGEVINPGVYEIDEGALLCDLIDFAGGLSENAPVEHINMVFEITDNISIYIPSSEEVRNQEYVGQFDESIIRIWGSNTDVKETFINETEIEETKSDLININTASKEILMTLPGIGDKMAQAIIDYRSGSVFESIEDVKNVPGIGEAKFQKIEQFICVN